MAVEEVMVLVAEVIELAADIEGLAVAVMDCARASLLDCMDMVREEF